MVGKVEIKDLKMSYASFGSGDKNLVIIPGLSLRPVTPFAIAIENAYGIFKEEYTVYLLDRRDDAPDNYTSVDMANDTYKVLSELGIDKAYFVGASQGGAIVMELSLMYPQMVEAICVASSSPYINDMSRNILSSWIELARKRDAIGLATHMVNVVYSTNMSEHTKEGYIHSFKDLSEEEFNQFLNLCVGFASYDIRSKLSSITCPAIIVGCEGDRVFGPETSREIYKGISSSNDKCELIIYDDSYGHAVYDEAEDFKEKIYEFFKRCYS